jgi:predicted DsbA family dithiol-disulfide isomerase
MTTAPPQSPIALEIFSDVACPWCYIGKKRLARALSGSPFQANLRWRAFELQPQLPPEGVEARPYFLKKFGSAARLDAIFAQVTQAGKGEGIAFDFPKMTRAANTRLAHQLIALSAESGAQDATVDALFWGNFEGGVDISKVDALIELVRDKKVPLDYDELRGRLVANEARAQVIADEEEAAALGISGVPFFIAQRKVALSGAQSPEVFRSFLEESLRA